MKMQLEQRLGPRWPRKPSLSHPMRRLKQTPTMAQLYLQRTDLLPVQGKVGGSTKGKV